MKSARRYRFSPLDTTGWLYGLSGQQCILLAAGVFTSGLLLDVHAPALAIAAPVLLAIGLAFARIGADSIVDRVGIELGILSIRLRRHRIWTVSPSKRLPPFLDHLEFTTLQGTNIGAIVNHAAGTVSAIVMASTRGFVLGEDNDQESALELWGEVLSGYASIASPIKRISLCESTVQGGGTKHVTYVTMTTSTERTTTNKQAKHGTPPPLVDQLTLLATHLRNGGLIVPSPLTRQDLIDTMNDHLSPASLPERRTLVGIAQLRRSISRIELHRHSVQADGHFHSSYWVSRWPATDVAANWLEPLLMHDNVSRTVTIHMEPVLRSASRRHANKIATKLETDATQKERAGFRIDEAHRRTRQAAENREGELGAGYCEFQYVGFITVTHSSGSGLRASCLEFEQVAAMSGIELSPLPGRHDLGMLYSLPLGQCPDRKRFSA